MNDIHIRYGESLTIPITVDDTTATTATFYVGKAGELPVITAVASITAGEGVIEISDTDTQIPLDTYKYQITVQDGDGNVSKYPDPEACADCDDDSFPLFCVHEALDATEVVS